jgi:CheY-like chemotaxis protein
VHSLLTESTWQGADLRELIRDQLLQGPVDETKLTAWGPAVHLGSQTTLHVALMLHELGTNSAKYGALSATGGWVTVSWVVKHHTLHLQWEERGWPVVAAPVKRGFGMTLIEQSAKSEGGHAQMLVEARGVTWQIELPLRPSRAGAPSAVPEAELLSATPGTDESEAARAKPALAGRRLLVIEDEPLIALAIVSILESAGAEVARPAGTEKDALTLIAEGRFDGALLDANLHGRPVGELAAQLTRRGIPFVFVTGYSRQALPESFRQTPILTKPFSDRELLDAAASLVPRSDRVVSLKK